MSTQLSASALACFHQLIYWQRTFVYGAIYASQLLGIYWITQDLEDLSWIYRRPHYGAGQIAAPIVLLAKGAMTVATD